MNQNNLRHSIIQNKTEGVKYTTETDIEGKVIVAACLAATKIFKSPSYLDHSVSKIFGKIKKDWRDIDEINGIDFPEGTPFFRMIIVNFRGHRKNFIMIPLEGVWKKGEIKWSIKDLSAPGHISILSEKELKKFS